MVPGNRSDLVTLFGDQSEGPLDQRLVAVRESDFVMGVFSGNLKIALGIAQVLLDLRLRKTRIF